MKSLPFLIADPHFGHEGVCRFLRADGSKLRPWTSAAEMDEALVARWNAVVSTTDKVYVLGDVVINRRALQTLWRLNGDLILIKGNHDIFKPQDYSRFRDVRGYHILGNCILSHIPIHPESLSRWKANIHGHLHAGRVMLGDAVDSRYYCVSVEHMDFAPRRLDVVLAAIEAQQ